MSARPAPLVSVIVPVHDVAPYVAEAIASLRAQTLADFEALIIDDGSTDGSGAVAAQAIGGDPRFVLIRQDNAGLSGARNAGLERARGGWLAFLDGDDAYEPGFLAELTGAAQEQGLPWAASALWLVEAGRPVAHSGLHGSPDPAGMAPRRLDLTAAPDAARLFPSAWNKVYRRDLWDDLRYRPGTWFEDHEVFWALAARAPAIWHLPKPLYRHRRDRPGQITGADDDRALHLFPVLDRLAPLIRNRPQGQAGLTALAARLIDERARVLRHPARRARFLTMARDWLRQAGVPHDPVAGGPDLSRGLALVLRDRTPLTIIRAGGAPAPGPDDQDLPLPGPGATLAHMLTQARGAFVVLQPAGQSVDAAGAAALVDAALNHDADLALGGLQTEQGWHDGWMDNRAAPLDPATLPQQGAVCALTPAAALRLHPCAARAVIRADLAARLGPLSVPLSHPLAGAELVMRAALAARSVALAPAIAAHLGTAPPVRAAVAAHWAAGLPDLAPGLPKGWRSVLALRAIRPGLPPARSLRGLAARLAAAPALRRAGLHLHPDTPADPGTDRIVIRLAGG